LPSQPLEVAVPMIPHGKVSDIFGAFVTPFKLVIVMDSILPVWSVLKLKVKLSNFV
jgi:hypothetical protein